MLKSAKDMSQVSHQALLDSAREEQRQREQQAAHDAQQKRVEQERQRRHARLIEQALAAARKGDSFVVTTDTNVDSERLAQQGFTVEKLTRRRAFEQHLQEMCQQLELNSNNLAYSLIQDCPKWPQLKVDHYGHSNPLISLARALQRTTPHETWTNVHRFKAQLYFPENQGNHWLNTNTKKFQELLNIEEKLWHARIKLNSVSRDNLRIPNDFSEATLVSWEDGGRIKPRWDDFSVTHLFWLAKEWGSLQEAISKIIETAAVAGLFSATVSMSYDSDVWSPFGPEELTEVTGRFANPLYVANELERLGYICELKMHYWMENEEDYRLAPHSSVEQFIIPEADDGYCDIVIGWANDGE